MKTVAIKYNPYTVETTIEIDGRPSDALEGTTYSTFKNGNRLQYWLESRPEFNWEGLLPELRKACNTRNLNIDFTGTVADFKDLQEVVDRELVDKRNFDSITLTHVNSAQAEKISPDAKLHAVKEVYKKIKNGSVSEFCTPKIEKAFHAAADSDFEIMVAGTMSSGKSTVINSILGHDLLPAINQATTAVLTRIRDVDGAEGFTIKKAVDAAGQASHLNEPATPALIEKLNGSIDPNDPAHKRALYSEIEMEGDAEGLTSGTMHTVFLDTPGGNNDQNEEHMNVLEAAINNEDNSMILYIFNGRQVSTKDNAKNLKMIADAMKKSQRGKQSRDRFLFVATQMDDFDLAKESYESIVNNIKTSLAKVGIQSPNLFLVSALTAKLLRVDKNDGDEVLTDKDWSDLQKLTGLMSSDSRALYEYSSLTEAQKEKFRREAAEIKAKCDPALLVWRGPGSPELALINSGIPALEMAINEYLQKYAIAIKVRQVQDSFMGVVEDKKIIEGCHNQWAESEESFKHAQKDAEEKKKVLDNDTALHDSVEQLKAIKFNKQPYRDLQSKLITNLNELLRPLQDATAEKDIDKEKVEQLLQKYQEEASSAVELAHNMAIDSLENDVEAQCNAIMQSYQSHMDTLKANGLDEIGGIRIGDLSVVKSEFSFGDISAVVKANTKTETRKRLVEDDGLFGGAARLFGGFFSFFGADTDDWGYHYSKYTYEVVDLNDIIQNEIAPRNNENLSKLQSITDSVGKQVEIIKQKAEEQIQQLDSIVRDMVEEYHRATRDRDQLKKENEQKKAELDFAKEIKNEMENILSID